VSSTTGTATGVTTGAGKCTITATAPANGNYSTATAVQSFTIYPAVLTVTPGSPTIMYGQSIPALTYTLSGYVGTDANANPPAVNGAPALSTTATSSSAPGTYPIVVTTGTLAAANYSFLFKSGTLTIQPAALTVTASSPTVTYGSTVPTITPSYNGFVGSDTSSVLTSQPACSTAYTVTSAVGSLPSTSCSGAAAANYSISYVGGHVTITQASQTITFTQPASPVTYGVTPIALSATTTAGLTVTFSIDPASTAAATISSNKLTVKGAGNLVIDANQAGSSNYRAATLVQRTIVVSKANLTLTANNASRAYGLANPTLTASYSGFVNGDTAATAVTGSPSLTTTAVAASLPGSYPITLSQGTLAASNYTFNFVNGALTVTFTGSVPASSSTCNGAYSGTFNGNLSVAAGQTCVFVGGGASGNITETGGNLVLSGATVSGNVTVSGSSTYSIGPSTTIKGNLVIQSVPTGTAQNQVCGTTVSGITIQSAGTAATIGSGTPSCPSNKITGSLTLQADSAAITVSGNSIGGSLTDQSNTAAITLSGNTVSGSLTDQGNSGASVLSLNSIAGTLVVQSNSGATNLSQNTVGGNLTDQGNTALTQVVNNKVTGTLLCQSNTSITGSGDTASKLAGQCATF
jgi:hypothetical protein